MSGRDLESSLSRWLDDGPENAPQDVIEAGLSRARQERQMRTVNLPWSRVPRLAFPDYRSLAQLAVTFAAITLAVVIGIWGANNVFIPPAATPSPSVRSSPVAAPSPTATESPTPLPSSTLPSSPPPSASSSLSTPSPIASPAGNWRVPELIGAGDFDDVAMTVDPQTGFVYAAAAIGIGAGDSRGIVYITNRSGDWTSEQIVTAPPGHGHEEYDGEPDIAVDTDGSVWIAFTRDECGGCTPSINSSTLVVNNVSGSWSKPQQVAGAQSYAPSIAVRDGIAHIAYASGQMPEGADYSSFYATNGSGKWVSTRVTQSAVPPQLVLDSGGVPMVASATSTGMTLTVFPSADATLLEDLGGPTSTPAALFLTLDPADSLHVVWLDWDGVMQELVLQPEPGAAWTSPLDIGAGRFLIDNVAIGSDGVGVVASARGLEESDRGPWFITADNGSAVRLAEGEITKTDLTRDGTNFHFVYSYEGAQAEHGIWYTEMVAER